MVIGCMDGLCNISNVLLSIIFLLNCFWIAFELRWNDWKSCWLGIELFTTRKLHCLLFEGFAWNLSYFELINIFMKILHVDWFGFMLKTMQNTFVGICPIFFRYKSQQTPQELHITNKSIKTSFYDISNVNKHNHWYASHINYKINDV